MLVSQAYVESRKHLRDCPFGLFLYLSHFMAVHSRIRAAGWALERLADDRDRFSNEQLPEVALPIFMMLRFLPSLLLKAIDVPPTSAFSRTVDSRQSTNVYEPMLEETQHSIMKYHLSYRALIIMDNTSREINHAVV